MRVARWGHSLAIRIPTSIVAMLGLKEGDDVVVTASGDHSLGIARDTKHDAALARLRAMKVEPPPGFAWRREDAYEE